MHPTWRKITAIAFASALLGAFTGPAWGAQPPHQCNAGNGNGFETDPANDCDPGNSGGNNNGGG
jgi:hypothetical protein